VISLQSKITQEQIAAEQNHATPAPPSGVRPAFDLDHELKVLRSSRSGCFAKLEHTHSASFL